jgi:ferredoxin
MDLLLNKESLSSRPAPEMNLMSQKMGIHEWSYDNEIANDTRFAVPWADIKKTLKNVKMEVELGFDAATAWKEAQRCLNCDVQTVFTTSACIECDACVDICPMDCISFVANGEEKELRGRLSAPALNSSQDLYVSENLKTSRVMVKDEDVCLHCGLCAERCPTGAWDMQKSLIEMTLAGRRAHHADQQNKPRKAAYETTHRSGQRLRRQVRQRQRLGLGLGQRAVRAHLPAHGHPGLAAQHLPSNIQGPADLVRRCA